MIERQRQRPPRERRWTGLHPTDNRHLQSLLFHFFFKSLLLLLFFSSSSPSFRPPVNQRPGPRRPSLPFSICPQAAAPPDWPLLPLARLWSVGGLVCGLPLRSSLASLCSFARSLSCQRINLPLLLLAGSH
ncbi:uncharacterized protein ARB_07791 [Trichophyton benhamiae CBS 112371]|uniref:Uncharacterized protein n=1 Tax=Arthroderma benhamiae (strain ATCC MYA-4681 / CBS 112371) TaxID=663331 RepID=D4ATX8_ARTBC|nr:uncharacterized protein ARB_07791 [Trichophyton benhamiae CBS 112371]EFE33431.1 hypothetical protein ARB_07791 [Trichophyton benhamiae CBS 112371]